MKRACQTALVGAAILCALVLSASSTVALAARVGVPGWAHPFAVGLLEVVAVAGTWIWMTDPRLRLEAAAAVGMASTVTGIGGVTAYGWFGAVGPVGLIVTVHLIARAWTIPAHPDTSALVVDPPTAITAAVETPAVEPVVEPVPDTTPGRAAAHDEDQRLAKVRELVADGAGRGTVAKELDLTPAQARNLIEKVRAA